MGRFTRNLILGKLPNVWDCKRCGLGRSNLLTHTHGVEIDKQELQSILNKYVQPN